MEEEVRTSPSEVDGSSNASEPESELELMVTSRTKRTTAGNRYSALVAQEEIPREDEEDDVALLFAEIDGEDEAYEGEEGADDADMSSSDDNDQGPDAGADDLEGEKELEKQAKHERAKKRKADLAMTTMAGVRKKPRVDPTSLGRATIAKPTKRKERISWLPDQEAAPGRTSLRKQTIAHRAATHAKLKENEEQRLKMKAIRVQRELEREADAPKEMTQADRLAEAERVEKRNAKSLNRWEAMEKKRQEEQAAKLAALKERKLQGAVVSWYSARHAYNGLRDKNEGDGDTPIEGKKRGRKSKAFLEQQLAAAKLAEAHSAQSTSIIAQPAIDPLIPDTAVAVHKGESPGPQMDLDQQQANSATNAESRNFLTGIHQYASMPGESNSMKLEDEVVSVPASSNMLPSLAEPKEAAGDALAAELTDISARSAVSVAESGVETTGDVLTTRETGSALPVTQARSEHEEQITTEVAAHTTLPMSATDQSALPAPDSKTPADDQNIQTSETPPVVQVISTRNLVILDRFEELPDHKRGDFSVFSNNRKTAKPAKHIPALCFITGLPARYRDPITGMGYHNAAAFKKLKGLRQHQYNWSGMLGCYVGRKGFAARGIPDGFLEH